MKSFEPNSKSNIETTYRVECETTPGVLKIKEFESHKLREATDLYMNAKFIQKIPCRLVKLQYVTIETLEAESFPVVDRKQVMEDALNELRTQEQNIAESELGRTLLGSFNQDGTKRN